MIVKYPITRYGIPLEKQVIPAVAPDGSNREYFLIDGYKESLIKEIDFPKLGNVIETAPLRTGPKFDLYGASNASMLIQAGLMDVASTIDPGCRVKELYVDVLGTLLVYDVSDHPHAVAVPSLIGDTRQVLFNMDIGDLAIDYASLDYFGNKLWWWHEYIQDSIVTFGAYLGGSLALSRGTIQFTGHSTTVAMRASDGPVTGDAAVIYDVIKSNIKVVGFTLTASFT